MPFRELVATLARNIAQANNQQAPGYPAANYGQAQPGGYQNNQQQWAQYQQQPGGQQQQGYPASPPPAYTPWGQPPVHGTGISYGAPSLGAAFSWGSLINQDRTASALYLRLLDGIFNFADRSCQPQNSQGLEPAKSAALYDELGYPVQGNPSKSYLQLATQNGFPMPEAARNEMLTLYYDAFSFQYTGQGAMPVLTRQGFHAAMVMDTLVDPAGHLNRLNHILSRHHANILDPTTNMPFPLNQIPRDAFPVSSDGQTIQNQRSRNVQFNAQFSLYLQNMQQMQQMKHFNTMAAMPNTYMVTRPGNGYGPGYVSGGWSW